MRVGQRVKLKCDDEVRGTITRLRIHGGFTVTYDGRRVNGRLVKGGRYHYTINHADYFAFQA